MISTVVGIAVVVLLSFSVLMGGGATLFMYLRRQIVSERGPQSTVQDRLSAIEGAYAALELQVRGLPSLWEDERKRAKRSHDAANTARRSAEEKLEEIEELIESANGILPTDGEGIPDQGVLPLRSNMGVPATPGLKERAAAVEHLLR